MSGNGASDIWKDYDKALKEHRERLIKDQQDIDREINFALFGLGFCIGVIAGYLI